MEDLSKQQLVLIGLLVSFVTSLATGIVTVSLMDQAPDGTTRTVSQVIEKTIQQIVPADTTANAGDTQKADIQTVIQTVKGSMVSLKGRSSSGLSGTGLIVSKSGIVLTDKAAIAGLSDYAGVFSDGTILPLFIIQSQDNGDIVFLAPSRSTRQFISIEFSSSTPDLGETVLSLSGTSTLSLGQGLVSESFASTTAIRPHMIHTTIAPQKVLPGSPLFDADGNVLGMRTSGTESVDGLDGSVFYAINQLKAVIPVW